MREVKDFILINAGISEAKVVEVGFKEDLTYQEQLRTTNVSLGMKKEKTYGEGGRRSYRCSSRQSRQTAGNHRRAGRKLSQGRPYWGGSCACCVVASGQQRIVPASTEQKSPTTSSPRQTRPTHRNSGCCAGSAEIARPTP